MEPCRACGSATAPFATDVVLGHVDASYEQCDTCGGVQAVEVTWLEEAYSSAIARLDVGLLDRCQILSSITAAVLRTRRLRSGTFLDWAGGYGTMTRLMRDRGYHFSHTDPMASNVFADGFDVAGPDGGRFDLVTAFEVLEHLTDPVESLRPVADATDLLLTTTQVLPQPAPQPSEWWYYTLESGQHITFYTRRGLEGLAERLGFDGVVSGGFVHLFHRGPVSALTRFAVQHPGVAYGLGHLAAFADRRHSLLAADLEQAKAAASQSG
ncbi:methyltransferase domain-containing protein [Nocardioides sp. MAH-18]|uniref:Methyltransferase domain-containing protein n=1 Tax=Nocardioides agri TaxID=2682843 RepID=A0A6L6XP60_9ACTN|nr:MULTISPECIES: class I SAM-dependent methyltransferase [unclassified Nocardioides]MBA2953673.1 class I SAM-dependent methyltransferase [Nocardioides sp. CGMCC 1.13656]MVQ48537.1 methyltransferase domain-containing protein [Nocardioides sp. MAH-18]